ncbi:TIGR02147 family protein [Bdellovibrio sp. HCB2-146]|uniref:TIGR02147 family protein n=1 Tax=Bdellovibrio sp. HCB2-146 TaxID=3394362 RepID=UPI0039BC3621
MAENFYFNFLNQEFDRRVQKNSHYSLRSFARDLGVSASWLSEVLARKKGISLKKAQALATTLQLSHQERQYFILSVQAHHSRSPASRQQARELLNTLAPSDWNVKKMTSEDFHPISEWYFNAILEVLELNDCQHTTDWIAKRLSLPLPQVEGALEKLVSLNVIKMQNGRYTPVINESETTYNVPSDSIKLHHRQMLQKAGEALQQQSVLHREFLNMTLSFDADRLNEAQQEIRHFQRQFADKFYSKEKAKNSVYQFSLQFFRLDFQKESCD